MGVRRISFCFENKSGNCLEPENSISSKISGKNQFNKVARVLLVGVLNFPIIRK